jgi:hypothetical protein
VTARIAITGGDAISRKLAALDKRARGRAAREIGRDVGRAVLPIMKSETRKRTGGLQKAHGVKVKVYRNGAAVVTIIGPRTSASFTRVSPRKVKRIKTGDAATTVAAKKAGTYYRPSRIAHLAGPQRKSTTLPRTVARARGPVQAVFIKHMHSKALNA